MCGAVCVWVRAGKVLLNKLGELIPLLKSRKARLEAQAAAIKAQQVHTHMTSSWRDPPHTALAAWQEMRRAIGGGQADMGMGAEGTGRREELGLCQCGRLIRGLGCGVVVCDCIRWGQHRRRVLGATPRRRARRRERNRPPPNRTSIANRQPPKRTREPCTPLFESSFFRSFPQ